MSSSRWRRKHRAEAPMVPEATFTSYSGQPILHRPTWKAPDIPGYLFLGGLAGAGSVIAAGAQLTGRPVLARTMKSGCAAAAGLSLAALVHDLGRPARFLNMLRTFKPTSPMSVGSWLLSAYAPMAAAAALSDLTGSAPWAGQMPGPQPLPPGLIEEGRAIPVARVQAMHEGKRRKRAREAQG